MQYIISFFTVVVLLLSPSLAWAAPNYSASPSAEIAGVSCESLEVVEGNNNKAPQTVVFETKVSGEAEKIRYVFGDGKSAEGGSRMEHEYLQGGTYHVRAEVFERDGDWVGSEQCKTEVNLETVNIVPHRSECTELQILSGNDQEAPSAIVFEVTGFDNKDALQGYIMDFGDGSERVSQEEPTFKHTYDSAGTYETRAWVIDSKSAEQGGTPACSERVTVKTQVMTEQPDTGAESIIAGLLMAGLALGGFTLMVDAKTQRR